MSTLKNIIIDGHRFSVTGAKSGGTATVYFLAPETTSKYAYSPAARMVHLYEGNLAVKVPLGGSLGEAFAGECRTWLELKHKAFVPLLKVVKINSSYAALMPKYESDLAAHIESPQHHPVLCKEFVEIVKGLEWAWASLGVLHLDLKPENILIDRSPTGCLLSVSDWGMAKVNEIAFRSQRIISADSRLAGNNRGGTLFYMSPRRVRSLVNLSGCAATTLDFSEDIFSIGIILSELCLRRRVSSIYNVKSLESFLAFISCGDYHKKLKVLLTALPQSPLISIALDCCSPDQTLRPNYTQLIERLTNVV